jgi:hypothetical protein
VGFRYGGAVLNLGLQTMANEASGSLAFIGQWSAWLLPEMRSAPAHGHHRFRRIRIVLYYD